MALDYNIIGERLKKARNNKKITQEKLAEQLDVSIAFLSRIERGSSHINLKRLTQICEILEVSEGYILNGTSNNSENYLSPEFNNLLNKVSPEKQKLIYKIAKVVIEKEVKKNKYVNKLIEFIKTSKRGVCIKSNKEFQHLEED